MDLKSVFERLQGVDFACGRGNREWGCSDCVLQGRAEEKVDAEEFTGGMGHL